MAEKLRTSMAFRDARELGNWLAEHHDNSSELWVQIFKAGSGRPSVTWTDCVVEAIRFGWIDGQRQSFDAASFLQRLTPRKPRSNWSAKNREHATRLIAEGLMAPAGLAHVDAAKADGRWDAAYAGSAAMVIPQDFLDALETMPEAKAFFETLDRKNLYPIYYRLQTAKRPETRAKRMAQILAQLERGERFY
ncbi:YdeI/OmpD-associated family protein [Microvirga sp. HBU67558]|uniref:YdeI/OmpD-associated family protein n=1 Tax=Microvirga TaxID=186650 RepID=UPI001B36683F|nr:MULTISPECIES: YdeI/OmpD-associated family protein [unclassified Microvirga]MBQ0819088.1 YdeI/OmpD-associated family protein [Microvirga sp. HBU67558]